VNHGSSLATRDFPKGNIVTLVPIQGTCRSPGAVQHAAQAPAFGPGSREVHDDRSSSDQKELYCKIQGVYLKNKTIFDDLLDGYQSIQTFFEAQGLSGQEKELLRA
jgi:hypothetical protein